MKFDGYKIILRALVDVYRRTDYRKPEASEIEDAILSIIQMVEDLVAEELGSVRLELNKAKQVKADAERVEAARYGQGEM